VFVLNSVVWKLTRLQISSLSQKLNILHCAALLLLFWRILTWWNMQNDFSLVDYKKICFNRLISWANLQIIFKRSFEYDEDIHKDLGYWIANNDIITWVNMSELSNLTVIGFWREVSLIMMDFFILHGTHNIIHIEPLKWTSAWREWPMNFKYSFKISVHWKLKLMRLFEYIAYFHLNIAFIYVQVTTFRSSIHVKSTPSSIHQTR
jgi:hypothetical protein